MPSQSTGHSELTKDTQNLPLRPEPWVLFSVNLPSCHQIASWSIYPFAMSFLPTYTLREGIPLSKRFASIHWAIQNLATHCFCVSPTHFKPTSSKHAKTCQNRAEIEPMLLTSAFPTLIWFIMVFFAWASQKRMWGYTSPWANTNLMHYISTP